MLVKKDIINDDDQTVGYIEAVFDSTSNLKTIFFPKKDKLYISYKRGGTYSYGNITNEIYEKFEKAESQGKFLSSEIKPFADKYPYRKEFTLFINEINEINNIIKESKNG